MKKLKNLIYLIIIMSFIGCINTNTNTTQEEEKGISYTEKTVNQFNDLEPPVILHSKSKDLGYYGVVVMDGNNKVHVFGNMSSLADRIGESYMVGDTIKKVKK